VTPKWPRANGKAESFMKKLGKVVRTAKLSGQNKYIALDEFLRAYRETPHSSTGVAPNHLLFGFSRATGIPSMLPETAEQKEIWRKTAIANDAKAKRRMEAEYNRRMRVKEPIITIGSKVLIKLKRNRKSDSEWDVKRPYVVTAVKGSMVTDSRDDHTTTRNSSCFKLYRFDLDEDELTVQVDAEKPTAPGVSFSEAREEAPPVSSPQETHPQDVIVEMEPGTSSETAEGQALPAATSKPPGKRGRPPGQTAQESKRKHLDNWEVKRAKNPPTRQSDRLLKETK